MDMLQAKLFVRGVNNSGAKIILAFILARTPLDVQEIREWTGISKREIIDAQTGIFLWETVAPIFASLLDGVTQVDFLERITDMFDDDGSTVSFDLPKDAFINPKGLAQLKKPARLAYRRKQVIVNVFDSMTTGNDLERIHKSQTPITEFAKAIHGIATTWGVKLPKEFDKQAATGDEAVKLAISEYDKNRKGAK